ncbi:MAG: hypothetical protein V4644_01045 [Patescibacteria group bacterium]
MEPGLKETKKFFTEFTWFERKEVRDEENLSKEDLKYVKGWTIAPLGYGNIFYIAGRKLPDILFVFVITYLYFEVTELINVESMEGILALIFFLLTLFMLGISFYSTYFVFRHGKRLSWNRGRLVYARKNILQPKLQLFETVDQLRASERNFIRYNVIPSLVIFGLLMGFTALLLSGFISFGR